MPIKRRAFVACAILVIFVLAGSSGAGVVYTDFGPSDSFRYWTAYGVAGSVEIAAPFTPSADCTFGGIKIALFNSGAPNEAELTLVNDKGGLPGTTTLESFSLVGLPHFSGSSSSPTVQVSSSSHPSLLAGDQYWLVASVNSADTHDDWCPSFSGSSNWAYNEGTGWFLNPFSGYSVPAFEIDSVPEPISMIFFGTGLVVVGEFIARRKIGHKA